MTENKNARPIAPTTGQADGIAGSNLQTHFTLSKDRNQSEISDFLGKEKANAVSLRQLRKWTGFEERTIRRRIAAERKRCVLPTKHWAKEIYRAADILANISFARRHLIVATEEQTAVEG